MKFTYSIDTDQVILDYSSAYCESADKLFRSAPFERIVFRYIEKLAEKGSPIYDYLTAYQKTEDGPSAHKDLLAVLNLLTTHPAEEVATFNPRFEKLLQSPNILYEFVEGLYDFWRAFERYIVMSAPKTKLRTRDSIHHAQFIKANETLRQLILRTYRCICENLINTPFRVYRQLPAGAHMGLLNQNVKWDCPPAYDILQSIPFIRLVLLEPPVIFYPKMNTRSGIFKEVSQNPIEDSEINPEDWFCYPAKIGNLLAFAYFHKRFMAQGTSLANLFELAQFEDVYNQKPDIVLLFGATPSQISQDLAFFHHDSANNIMVGYVVNSETVDYFGYMKKMLLTLHNVIMLNRGLLPLHGAMVSVQLKSKIRANIIVVGDSGAGKSETLEAFRIMAQDYISEMTIIFDDMGSLRYHEGQFCAYGTEIGAFLRLDDLQPGYAFKQMDRSIFMNPNLTNARVILPVTTYRRVVQGTPVDFFLYANNYEVVDETEPAIKLFATPAQALNVFSNGKRMAKGTTSEKGLVESYFANPFGAPQKRKVHEDIAADMLNKMFKQNIAVGELRTQLGVTGFEQLGPQLAAKALFELMADRLK